MKNFILFVLLSCFIPQIVNAQAAIDADTEPKLKGRVKKVIEYSYHSVREDINLDSLKYPEKTVENFNENGDKTDESNFDRKGGLIGKMVFDNTDPKKIIQTMYDNRGDLMAKYISIYDKNGNVIEEGTYLGWTQLLENAVYNFKFIYKYDNRNNRIEADSYRPGDASKDRPGYVNTYVYNEQNQMTNEYEIKYLPKVIRKGSRIVTCSLDGNERKFQIYDSNNKLISGHTFSYSNIDTQGNWLLMIDDFREKSKINGNVVIKDIVKREITYYE
ncbi:hypothetical protein [Mucilaginibacter flavidus]|uniref:hypothetical protein n=1 Tax=Mucilaginibacter flavidus TaxID=2949309 RepID=UPI0020939386|nr:hypothetical protein [Mucilaginibacter flavidus]MCO5946967.1 hypothetical protein [Mucilaginibacter flavidus]